MPEGIPKIRLWQSRKKTLQVAEMGFDILEVLSRTNRPQSVSELLKTMGHSQLQSGYLINALRVLHKTGHIEGDGEVNRIRLSADMTRVSITSSGRQLLTERRPRLEFGKRMMKRR